jgi:hypothetical protein
MLQVVKMSQIWNTAQNTEEKREKIRAFSLAKECYSMKLELLTNATVVDDAIRFVADKSKDKEKLKSSTRSDKDGKETYQSDYNEDRDQLGEEKQEEETGGITTNHIF